jgi:hypothetical protein
LQELDCNTAVVKAVKKTKLHDASNLKKMRGTKDNHSFLAS